MSNFADHLMENQRTFNVENDVKVLHTVDKGKRLNALELIEIRKAQKNGKFVLNDQTPANIIDHVVLAL